MSETKKILEVCNDCGACVRTCTFLSHYCDTPKELAKRFKRNPLENIVYLTHALYVDYVNVSAPWICIQETCVLRPGIRFSKPSSGMLFLMILFMTT